MKKLSRSIKKYLRREKARLRRSISDATELDKALENLAKRFYRPDAQ